MELQFLCQACGTAHQAEALTYRCQCGGLFDLGGTWPKLPDDALNLGEVVTPLLPIPDDGLELYLKMEGQQPTGSFKDRGARYLVDYLRRRGISRVVEDSSGNAASSLAAYCAAAGLGCELYVPEKLSPAKVRQMTNYGAKIMKVPGPRDCASTAVQAAAAETYYASHVYNPLFFAGVQSMAVEIMGQLGSVPAAVIVPVGHGSLLLGLYHGFRRLGSGMPCFVAAQTAHCCPVFAAYTGDRSSENKPTIAEGIAVAKPPRLPEILTAVKASRGWIMTVAEQDIMDAWQTWARRGIYVEKTAAVALAALASAEELHSFGGPVVAVITGSGLKNA